MRANRKPVTAIDGLLRVHYEIKLERYGSFDAARHLPFHHVLGGVPFDVDESYDALFGGMTYPPTPQGILRLGMLTMPADDEVLLRELRDADVLMHPFAILRLAEACTKEASELKLWIQGGFSGFMRCRPKEEPRAFTLKGRVHGENPGMILSTQGRNQDLGDMIAWFEAAE